MGGKSSDPSVREAKMRGLAKGWRSKLPETVRSVLMGDKEVTREEIQARLEAPLPACDDVERLRYELTQAIRRRNAALEEAEPTARVVERFVRITHGEDATALRAYDLEPPKQHTFTMKEKAITTLRRLNTRAEKGTLGCRQRARLNEPTVMIVDAQGRRVLPRLPAPTPVDEPRVTVTEVRPPPSNESRQLSAPADDAIEP